MGDPGSASARQAASAHRTALAGRKLRDALYVKMRSGWWETDEFELWGEMASELELFAGDMGAAEVLNWLDTFASHTIRLDARSTIKFSDPEATAQRLYRQHLDLESVPNETRPSRLNVIRKASLRRPINRWLPLPLASTAIVAIIFETVTKTV